MFAAQEIDPSVAAYDLPLAGKIQAQYIRCGKPTCHCASGEAHGPYYYRTWRDGGRTRKVYVKPDEVDAVRKSCELHAEYKTLLRSIRARRREASAKLRQQWRETRALAAAVKKIS